MRRTLAALGAMISILLAGCDGSSYSGNGQSPPPPPPPPPPTVPAIGVTQAFSQISLSAPIALVQAPGDASRWYAAERGGVIHVFDNDPNADTTSVFLDISSVVDTTGEGGLLGFAFHPDFPATPAVFVSYTRSGSPLMSYISYFGSSDGGATLDAGSEQPLMIIPQNRSNHNGGHIAFGPDDGYLYVGFGDGGGGGDPDENAQDLTNVLGSMIRIDVSALTSYVIPPDNPFASINTCPQGFGGGATGCPEIYAYGLRNPWRWSFDRQTGDLWLGDVGQNAWEEVDIIVNGGDYGWDDREGAHCYEPASGCIMDSIEPITEYGRDLGNSITGGYVYRGSAIPDLVGWYVFGDYGSGRIFAIPADTTSLVEPEVLMDTSQRIVAFAEDADGELYFADIVNNTLHQIVEAP